MKLTKVLRIRTQGLAAVINTYFVHNFLLPWMWTAITGRRAVSALAIGCCLLDPSQNRLTGPHDALLTINMNADAVPYDGKGALPLAYDWLFRTAFPLISNCPLKLSAYVVFMLDDWLSR